MNGWLNIYKPRGVSSAKIVSVIKKALGGAKVGHAGTLDVEAEGVLPIAIGEATKLVQFLVDARKEYLFEVKFGAKTDTGDSAGKVIDRVDKIPSESECRNILPKFIGEISQTPSAYSAIKVNGTRAYKLARNNIDVFIKSRIISIYSIYLEDFDHIKGQALFRAQCSKGTYIRSLAEDISLSLQSLGFVIKLRRTMVGVFSEEASIDISEYVQGDWHEAGPMLMDNCLELDLVLADIPVLDLDFTVAQKIRYGQKLEFDIQDHDLMCLKCNGNLVAIGNLQNRFFKSSRVFNI